MGERDDAQRFWNAVLGADVHRCFVAEHNGSPIFEVEELPESVKAENLKILREWYRRQPTLECMHGG